MFKPPQDCTHFNARKIIPQILQAMIQQFVNLQIYKLDLEKTEEPESNFQHSLDHKESKRVPEKHLLLLH